MARSTASGGQGKRAPTKPPKAPAKSELDRVLDELSVEYLQCRDWGHSWRPFSALWQAQDNCYCSILRCARCGTERTRYIGSRGQLLGNNYQYADGYTMAGQGRMTSEDRDHIRYASIQKILTVDTVQE